MHTWENTMHRISLIIFLCFSLNTPITHADVSDTWRILSKDRNWSLDITEIKDEDKPMWGLLDLPSSFGNFRYKLALTDKNKNIKKFGPFPGVPGPDAQFTTDNKALIIKALERPDDDAKKGSRIQRLMWHPFNNQKPKVLYTLTDENLVNSAGNELSFLVANRGKKIAAITRVDSHNQGVVQINISVTILSVSASGEATMLSTKTHRFSHAGFNIRFQHYWNKEGFHVQLGKEILSIN
jgi:hypothetical protein